MEAGEAMPREGWGLPHDEQYAASRVMAIPQKAQKRDVGAATGVAGVGAGCVATFWADGRSVMVVVISTPSVEAVSR